MPTRLWRISDFADLSGRGGLLESARWHSRGRKVVYLSDHPASALLEVLVHLEIDVEDLPVQYQLLGVDAADGVTVLHIVEPELPENWRQTQNETRAVGDAWLAGRRSTLLRVPSAIVPEAHNYLFNPEHGSARDVRIVLKRLTPYNSRLFELGKAVGAS